MPTADAISNNPDWPLLAKLRPQLRQHVRSYPQQYRGERWYVLHDGSSGRHLRFNNIAYEFIGRLDGDHTTAEIWQQLQQSMGEEAITQDEVILILTQLFGLGALNSDMPADANTFFTRFQHERRLNRQRALLSPLSVRIPLFDPDRLLNRLMPRLRPIFSPVCLVLWLLIVGYASLLGSINFTALYAAINNDIFSPANMLSLAVLFVVIKLVHEFGHAFAVKMWGGEVHEMGITLLVLMPVPYVDASASWGFRDKRKRMLVGAAGILIELLIAALALLVWLTVEPGFIKDTALNTLLISGVSTLLFNANPLLRFDGYYVLQDYIEIPNLYTRSSRYYIYLIQRYLFGMHASRSPATAPGEAFWFAVYGSTAFVYRLFILLSIVLFLADEYLLIGVGLGTWAVVMQVIMPLIRGLRFLWAGAIPAGQRLRANLITALLLVLVSATLLFAPVPLSSQAEGVLWVSEQAQIYTKSSGFVASILVQPGNPVLPGTPIIQLHNPSLAARIKLQRARCRELQTRISAEYINQRLQSRITEEELTTQLAELALLEEQASNLLVRSAVAGIFVQGDQQTLAGRYMQQGQLLGYIVGPEHLIVRAAVPQSTIGLVQNQLTRVELRFAEQVGQTITAHIVRRTPSGSTTLPHRALGAAGGGSIAVERADNSGLTATEQVFQVDLGLPAEVPPLTGLGERAYIRFNHGSEPLAQQWWRQGRQLLLSRLDV